MCKVFSFDLSYKPLLYLISFFGAMEVGMSLPASSQDTNSTQVVIVRRRPNYGLYIGLSAALLALGIIIRIIRTRNRLQDTSNKNTNKTFDPNNENVNNNFGKPNVYNPDNQKIDNRSAFGTEPVAFPLPQKYTSDGQQNQIHNLNPNGLNVYPILPLHEAIKAKEKHMSESSIESEKKHLQSELVYESKSVDCSICLKTINVNDNQ
ncbi:hypothetical protein BB560_006639 [Smittium megazygosporum]|uniref:Uncharacterized protein n=1 Tax=Smittium megazygosporum TaxID=133381 RepID=A0A2T9Y2P1_9FUNG|nr:hypothetical protein BB560_006639 [Smittium megazygosporum]